MNETYETCSPEHQRHKDAAKRLQAHCQANQVKKITEYHPPDPEGKPAFIVEYQQHGRYFSATAYFDLEDLLVELRGQEVELMNPHDIKGNANLKTLLGTRKEILYAGQ